MSSLQQKTTQLLTFGYCNENYEHKTLSIPVEIKGIIQLFYDEFFYWKIKGNELKQYFNAKNGDVMHSPTTFKIKEIEFECTMCPDGWRSEDKGIATYYLEIKHLPSNIEYVRVYLELFCETTQSKSKSMRRWWNATNARGLMIGKRADYTNIDCIDTYCKVEILSIKYKSKINDYILPIKMNKYDEYEWIINDKLEMERMKSMQPGMSSTSKTFGYDNNWIIHLSPTGWKNHAKYLGKPSISICCVRLPFGITGLRVK